jgi:hypothetical protein
MSVSNHIGFSRPSLSFSCPESRISSFVRPPLSVVASLRALASALDQLGIANAVIVPSAGDCYERSNPPPSAPNLKTTKGLPSVQQKLASIESRLITLSKTLAHDGSRAQLPVY